MEEEKINYFDIVKVGLFKVILPIIVIALGIGAFLAFSSLKKPPAQAEKEERAIPVEVIEVVPEDFQVQLTGFGEVRTLASVPIASEVSGRVIWINGYGSCVDFWNNENYKCLPWGVHPAGRLRYILA